MSGDAKTVMVKMRDMADQRPFRKERPNPRRWPDGAAHLCLGGQEDPGIKGELEIHPALDVAPTRTQHVSH
jgi:hypothetical protein